jgi:hypothetical protein
MLIGCPAHGAGGSITISRQSRQFACRHDHCSPIEGDAAAPGWVRDPAAALIVRKRPAAMSDRAPGKGRGREGVGGLGLGDDGGKGSASLSSSTTTDTSVVDRTGDHTATLGRYSLWNTALPAKSGLLPTRSSSDANLRPNQQGKTGECHHQTTQSSHPECVKLEDEEPTDQQNHNDGNGHPAH